ncbi:helix-turn-helix domain-containing protein [Roseococcus microcysteis]|uniref:helix-turn-helix domain-containing protein n=1 Tax=Roseococcus microcysteis TaxID=2771361 RepID=UPI001CC4AE6D|nr:helix-turn-helix transcriptional regulator [Roseococcus microcysteis]
MGTAIRDERISRGWSQEELAARSSLHVTYISGIERGRRNPTLSVLWRLASALKMPLSALLSRAEAGGKQA